MEQHDNISILQGTNLLVCLVSGAYPSLMAHTLLGANLRVLYTATIVKDSVSF
jgi:hypothetical protein